MLHHCFVQLLLHWKKMVLRSETVSPNQVSDLLLGRRQKEKMIESLKTHFRLLVHARGEGEEECYWSCHGNSISGTPSSPHFPYLFIFLCLFLKNKRGRKKSEHFCEEFPGMLGGFAVVLIPSGDRRSDVLSWGMRTKQCSFWGDF